MAKKIHIMHVTWINPNKDDHKAHIQYHYSSKAKAMAAIKDRKDSKLYNTAPDYKQVWYSSSEIY